MLIIAKEPAANGGFPPLQPWAGQTPPETHYQIKEGLDIKSTTIVVELNSHRQMVKDTDKGKELQQQITDLMRLLYAYRNGYIKESERE